MLFVVQQIIHVLSGQLHLANATPLSLLAAVGHLSASVKWTVNIDGGDSKRRTATLSESVRKREMEGRDDGGMDRESSKRWRKRGRESSCLLPKATECALMHCGREHTVSPERERESSATHTNTHHTEFSLYHHVAF